MSACARAYLRVCGALVQQALFGGRVQQNLGCDRAQLGAGLATVLRARVGASGRGCECECGWVGDE